MSLRGARDEAILWLCNVKTDCHGLRPRNDEGEKTRNDEGEKARNDDEKETR
jgi:hypothetical protein